MAGLLPTMGVLGDRIGHRRTFLWGLLAFALASLIAAFAPSANVLIAARAFLAVGASMMMPATLSLLRLTFTTDKERGEAIGIWAAVFSGGVAIGPLIGGALLGHFWWGSVFLINVLVVVMALIFTPFVVPAGKENPERRLDLLNSLLAMIATQTREEGEGRIAFTHLLRESAIRQAPFFVRPASHPGRCFCQAGATMPAHAL